MIWISDLGLFFVVVILIYFTNLQKDSGHSQPLPYSPSWVVFRPNVLVDARTGDIFLSPILAP